MSKIAIDLRLLLICYLCLMLSSCSGNGIYFDVSSQTVNSCNNETISKLYVISEDGADFYLFTLVSGEKGTNKINLLKLDGSYTLENMYGRIEFDRFKLRPNTIYEIENSTVGDASSSTIKVKTNKYGMVIYSDISSCK